jgi:hypothetical protein
MDLGKFLFNILYQGETDKDGIKLEGEVRRIAGIMAQRPWMALSWGRKNSY